MSRRAKYVAWKYKVDRAVKLCIDKRTKFLLKRYSGRRLDEQARVDPIPGLPYFENLN